MTAQAPAQVQYVSDEEGQDVSVIVPIALWHEIASERETAYLTRLATYSKFAKNRILFSSKSRFEAVFGEFSPQSGVFIFKILNSTVNRA